MAFTVTTRTASAGDRTGQVYELVGDSARAEVWPFTGFNCLRWQVRNPDGTWGNVLFTAPEWEANPVPTRSGHPVLFPFPNRLRAGELDFGGKSYRLPLNDSTKANAIHGFSPRNPWRVLDSGGGPDSAFVTGQFRMSVDLPSEIQPLPRPRPDAERGGKPSDSPSPLRGGGGGEGLPSRDGNRWPGDGSLTLTYRLSADTLRVEATVQNHGGDPFPFGLGYHPYFRVPTAPESTVADGWDLFSGAAVEWETDGGVSTGKRLPIPPRFDFRTPHPLGDVAFDNLFADVRPDGPAHDGLRRVAFLRDASGRVDIHMADEFRELVLFTPVHRKAVAIEPYTCATDAAHLQDRGIDGGWRVLPAGGAFAAAVAYRWVPR